MLAALTPALPNRIGRGSYGMEFDLNATYSGIEHLDLSATGAVSALLSKTTPMQISSMDSPEWSLVANLSLAYNF